MTDIMIASTSHDMKTPLNSVLSMIDLIEKYIKDEKILNWIKVAKNSSLQLVSLV